MSSHFLQKILDLFYPKHSLQGISGCWITTEEWSDIPYNKYRESRVFLEERGLGSVDNIVSACSYHDSILLQRALFTFKYRRVPGLASKLANFIIQFGEEEMTLDSVLAPVPLHWHRQFDRGFNQAVLLARRTASVLDLPYSHLLKRVRDTGHQAWRSRDERMVSMHDAFILRRGVTVPRHVVLVDDIATTGATLDACAKALKNHGAVRVDAWVVARG
jgi:ComF family protein